MAAKYYDEDESYALTYPIRVGGPSMPLPVLNAKLLVEVEEEARVSLGSRHIVVRFQQHCTAGSAQVLHKYYYQVLTGLDERDVRHELVFETEEGSDGCLRRSSSNVSWRSFKHIPAKLGTNPEKQNPFYSSLQPGRGRSWRRLHGFCKLDGFVYGEFTLLPRKTQITALFQTTVY